MELVQKFLTRNPCYKNNLNCIDERYATFMKRGPVGLMLHSIGCPQPSAMVFYERKAWFDKDQPSLRITFDRNTRYRMDDLSYEYGSSGKLLFPDDTRILEIKACGAYPLWLCRALEDLDIRKQTFSKIATAFKKEYYKEKTDEQYIRIDNREQLLPGHLPRVPGVRVRVRASCLLCGEL